MKRSKEKRKYVTNEYIMRARKVKKYTFIRTFSVLRGSVGIRRTSFFS